MARYDVFPNLGGSGYLLDVQADILEDLSTRVVVPLVPATDKVKVVRRLNLPSPSTANSISCSRI
jgi:toxin CcdB